MQKQPRCWDGSVLQGNGWVRELMSVCHLRPFRGRGHVFIYDWSLDQWHRGKGLSMSSSRWVNAQLQGHPRKGTQLSAVSPPRAP